MTRKGILGLVAAISMSFAGSVFAGHCDLDFDSDYSLRVERGDLEFTRSSVDVAKNVRIEGSRVYVDGRELALTAEQKAHAAEFSQRVAEIFREAAEIGLEGVDIAYAAVTEVGKMFNDTPEEQAAFERRLGESRAKIAADIRKVSIDGPFDERELGRMIERNVETVVGDLVGTLVGDIVGEAISVALSGDEAKARELEKRAEDMEKRIEEQVERRAEALEARAEQLCERARTLAEIDNAMALRAPNGAAIDLLR